MTRAICFENDYMLVKKIFNAITQINLPTWKKNILPFWLFIAVVLSFLYFTIMPQWTSTDNVPFSDFQKSVCYRSHLKPHFVGQKITN
jgi:hypothetical protein